MCNFCEHSWSGLKDRLWGICQILCKYVVACLYQMVATLSMHSQHPWNLCMVIQKINTIVWLILLQHTRHNIISHSIYKYTSKGVSIILIIIYNTDLHDKLLHEGWQSINSEVWGQHLVLLGFANAIQRTNTAGNMHNPARVRPEKNDSLWQIRLVQECSWRYMYA